MNDLDKLREFTGIELKELEVPFAGIYFLFEGDELVYIGQSHDVRHRVRQHKKELLCKFDRAFYIEEIDAKRRVSTEIDLISTFQPSLNTLFTLKGHVKSKTVKR